LIGTTIPVGWVLGMGLGMGLNLTLCNKAVTITPLRVYLIEGERIGENKNVSAYESEIGQ
jgi:hypothetical protein